MQNKTSFSTGNQFNYSTKGTHVPEVPYMITEGRIEHLEAIAMQIEKYEKWEPKWDIIKISMSSFASMALFSAGLLVTNSATDAPVILPVIVSWIKGITVGTSLAAVLAFIMNCIHNKERKEQYKNEADKMRNIIKKVKESVVHDDTKRSPKKRKT